MLSICTELNELLMTPPSDTEPGGCFINKLRAMDQEERLKELSALNYMDQLKLARTHKVCLMLNHKKICLLKD